MKKLISVLMLICLMASFCTVSAFAEDVTVSTFADLKSAFAAGGNITLGANINADYDGTITVPSGVYVHLDLNGFNIVGEASATSHSLIDNNGTLVISDSGSTAGKIQYTYKDSATGYSTGNYTIQNCGNLTLNGVTVINSTALSGHMYDVVDNNSTLRDVSLTVNGAYLACNYITIRQFANSTTHTNSVVFNSGTSDGLVWMQNPSSNANKASIEISGGTFIPKAGDDRAVLIGAEGTVFNLDVSGGTFKGSVSGEGGIGGNRITGGTFTNADAVNNSSSLIASGFEVKENADGSFSAAKPTPEELLQQAINNGSSMDNPIEIPAQLEVTRPIVISGATYLKLGDSTFDVADISKNFEGSLFALNSGATVTITNVEGTADELKLMRELISKDYCVRQGSIIISDSHDLHSDGKCKVCGLQIVPNPYSVPATADNSNMPLWSALFIAFAAVALLTGKKRRA